MEVAYDGRAAIQAGATFGAELAWIDIDMPGADGYEVARQLHDFSPRNGVDRDDRVAIGRS